MPEPITTILTKIGIEETRDRIKKGFSQLSLEKEYEKLINSINNLIYIPNYDLAIEEIDRILNSDSEPKIPSKYKKVFFTQKIECLSQTNKKDEALIYYDKCLAIDIEDEYLWLNKAILLKELKGYKEAINCLDQGIKKIPESSTLYDHRGRFLYESKEYEQAILSFNKSLRIKPDNTLYLLHYQARAFHLLEKYDQAIYWYDKILSIYDGFDAVLLDKGIALFFLNKHEESLECFDQALKNANEFGRDIDNNLFNNIFYFRGNTLYSLDKYEESIDSFNQALKINSNDLEVWYNKGIALYCLGIDRYKEAIYCFDRVLEIDSEDSDAKLYREKALSDLDMD